VREYIDGIEIFFFFNRLGAIEIPIEFTSKIGELFTFIIAILVTINQNAVLLSLPCFSFLFRLFSLDR
jgi:hypothetical protein